MQSPDWDHIISLRQYQNSDLPFMQELYASTREEELALTNLSLKEKQAFIAQQFSAQYMHYTQNYCTDNFNIIEHNGKAVGRLFVDYWRREIRVVDISLVSSHRNKGLGTYLFNKLFKKAKQSSRSVTIHVEHNNPAKRLYERLGFVVKSKTNEIYLLMEWRPKD